MKRILAGCVAALAVAVLSTAALAYEMLDGDQIRSAVSGNTVEGTMTDQGPYSEYFDPDGTLRAKSYSGTWSIKDNAICIDITGGSSGCWNVGVAEGTLHWFFDGEVLGTGTATPGNTHGY